MIYNVNCVNASSQSVKRVHCTTVKRVSQGVGRQRGDEERLKKKLDNTASGTKRQKMEETGMQQTANLHENVYSIKQMYNTAQSNKSPQKKKKKIQADTKRHQENHQAKKA